MLLGEPSSGSEASSDVEDEVGDERLLERRREALDELRRQPPDEADGVGHEVALPDVLEAARRRVERLEEPVLDRHLGAGERVQERRLADVRVAGERDGRRLGAGCAPCVASRDGAPTSRRRRRRSVIRRSRADGRSRAATRRGRACRRRRRARAAPPRRSRCFHMPRMRGRLYSSCASSTCSLPSAETACWAKMSRISCVRSTTRADSASSSARCCVGCELVVDDQHLRRRARRRRPSAPRACPCRRSSADRAARGAGRPGRPARRRRCARAPGSSASSSSPSTPFGSTASRSPRSGSGPAARSSSALAIDGSMPRPPARYARRDEPLADRLAARTLELVDIASESLHEAAIRHTSRRSCPSAFAPVFEGDEAQLWARERRPASPLLVLAGHYDTVPAQDNVPGPDRRRRGARVRRERHEGRRRRRARARARARRDRARARRRRACSCSGARSCRRSYNPLPALFDALPTRARGRSRGPARADRPDRSRRAASGTSRRA